MTKICSDAENNTWAESLPGKMTSACIAICIDGKVLMVKANYKNHWTFPSGIVDEGESPKAAAIRETFEETGVRIDPENCELLAVVYTASNGHDRERFNFAFVIHLPSLNIELDIPNDEIKSAEWIDFQNVASKANGRKSYQVFQKKLLNQNDDVYFEI